MVVLENVPEAYALAKFHTSRQHFRRKKDSHYQYQCPNKKKVQNLGIGLALESMLKYWKNIPEAYALAKFHMSRQRFKQKEPWHQLSIGINADVLGKHSRGICIGQIPHVKTTLQKKDIWSLSIPMP
jgi:hypothetical protein